MRGSQYFGLAALVTDCVALDDTTVAEGKYRESSIAFARHNLVNVAESWCLEQSICKERDDERRGVLEIDQANKLRRKNEEDRIPRRKRGSASFETKIVVCGPQAEYSEWSKE